MEKCVLERLEKMRDFLSEKANYLKMERIKGISEQFVSNEGNINSNLKNLFTSSSVMEAKNSLLRGEVISAP